MIASAGGGSIINNTSTGGVRGSAFITGTALAIDGGATAQ
jgi:hypothetical protein